MRHPFPGPALGVRIIGEVTPARVEIVRKADYIFMSMIKEAGLYNEVRNTYLVMQDILLTLDRLPKLTLDWTQTSVSLLQEIYLII